MAQVCPRPTCDGPLAKQKLVGVAARKLKKDFWWICRRCFAGYVVGVNGKLRLVVEGLQLRTPKQTAPKAYRKRKQPKVANGQFLSGETHPTTKLTERDVRAIKERLKEGGSQTDIAREFAVGPTAIHDIKVGRTWRGVGEGEAE